MAKFKETSAKQAVRALLVDASQRLSRKHLTYLGLPAEDAVDIRLLAPLLENVICVDLKARVLDEARRAIAHIASLRVRQFRCTDVWAYLRDEYPKEPLVADVTFLDFYGGGITKEDPFAEEIAGLRSYFAKQAQHRNKAFVLAWTYMPRDRGKAHYIEACERIIPANEVERLRTSKGVWARSLAIRLLLQQSLREHGMRARVWQHAVYKRTMNTIVVVFSRGHDGDCQIELQDPASVLTAPVVAYETGRPTPRVVTLPGA
jgi:hypothetical protein